MEQANACHAVEAQMSAHGAARRRWVQAVPLLAAALWLRPVLASAGTAQSSRTLMGTRVDITVDGVAQPIAEAAMQAAWTEMTRLADMMSRYRLGNPVHALQLSAGLQPVPVPPEMMRVLTMGQAVSARSHGAFDMTVGALASWRFDRAEPVVPAAEEIARELPLVDYRDLRLDPQQQTAYLRRRGMRVDLGGIAKLPILQAGMAALKAHGVAAAMINGGGDVLVSGHPQGHSGAGSREPDWRIGVRDPMAPDRLIGVLRVRGDVVVAASGDYERGFTVAGKRYHHILDPDTGMPEQRMRGVVLVARQVDAINGMGPAMMVAGQAAGRRWLGAMPGVDALMVDAAGLRWMSAGMRERLGPCSGEPVYTT
ncbi:FAD:protein FMN transferase [Cupriavidus sp. D384]|uniref:FAD:protein FMN transferase n=1 Tax=Cupriavidus sp. D384 TaxID=1538095 RepID=UPI000B23FB26|nr:FAD:protein FMN transferase [Cupriavidus sp. D384]